MQTLQLLGSNKHLQQSEIHTLIMQMMGKEREKTITCSEQLQLKFLSRANIEANKLWQYVPPLAAEVFNQLYEISHCEHITEITK